MSDEKLSPPQPPTPGPSQIIQAGFSRVRANLLEAKNKQLNCPVCGESDFIEVTEGYLKETLSTNILGPSNGGPNIPEIALICTTCTHIIKFSAGVLGLFDLTSQPSTKTGE